MGKNAQFLDPGTIPGCTVADMNPRLCRIGEVALEAGVSPDTLRYYERMGLLPKVPRTGAGYRQYSDTAIERIRFIRNALRFGFALKEVATFLRASESGRAPCREVRASAGNILARVDRQIEELKAARRAIRETLADWDRRLAATPAGTPARLLRTLKPDQVPTDCLSARLKKAVRT
jgi:DNA-binding transcriptional MerR regulator